MLLFFFKIKPIVYIVILLSFVSELFFLSFFRKKVKKNKKNRSGFSPERLSRDFKQSKTRFSSKASSLREHYLSTRAPPPPTSFSTSALVAMVVSPGVVMASAPCAAP